MKKKIAVLLALALIITGALFFETDGSNALAAESAKDFIAEAVQDITPYRTGTTFTYPKPITSGKEDYIFAGWYQDSSCSQAYTETTIEGVKTAYAKFVPSEILSVKFQVSAGTDAASTSSNLRIVSSVDSINYSKIGFKILSLKTGVEKSTESKDVYKRIQTNMEGLEYGYSPVIFDTDSEYFMTVTLKNLTDFERTYSARAYWITLDGTEVVGTARNVKVSDSYNSIANVPVRLYTGDAVNSKTIASGSIIKITYDKDAFTWLSDVDSNLVAYEAGTMDSGVTITKIQDGELQCTVSKAITNPDGLLVNLRFKINSSASSTETFVMTSTDSITSKGLSNYIYNVYRTNYDADLGPDTSWYDEFAKTGENKFVVATARDLYGFASLVNENTERFEGDTIYLGADITVNKGQATSNGWDKTKDADGNSITDGTEYEWEAIGLTYTFQGTFEGQGNTISGIYLVDDDEYTTTAEYQGLFGQTDTDSTIRDFKLNNSYFENITGWFYDYSDNAYDGNYALMGSVVGQLKGNMDTVYSDAVVVSAHRHVGGLVGRTNGTMTISNCWFDGSLTVTEPELYGDAGGVGGILGRRASGNVTIQNCLNTADITYSFSTVNEDTTSYRVDVGGIAGYLKDENSKILDCMNAGTVSVTAPTGVDVSKQYGEFCTTGTRTHIVTASGDYTAGFNGYKGYNGAKAKLDFYDRDTKEGFWVCRETAENAIDGIPVLKSFCEEWIDVAWYYGDTTKSEFTINYAEELYGLSDVSNAGLVSFNGKTISLGRDVQLNTGLASVWKVNDNTEKRAFKPIGGNGTAFKGTFDGQGYNISGLYISKESSNLSGGSGTGLFGSATYHIQNVSLTNSFVDSARKYTGSIVGFFTSTMTNVYSDAYVQSTTEETGGLVGRYGGQSDNSGDANVCIKNSWFAGHVEAPNYYVGGIVGLCNMGTEIKTIQNCLNTGTVKSTRSGSTCLGGIIGGVYNATASNLKGFKLSNCLNSGTIEYKSSTDAGSVLGYTNIPVTFENVYTTDELGTATTGVGFIKVKDCSSTGEPIYVSQDNMTGNNAYIHTDLAFYDTNAETNIWGIVNSGTPVIKKWYEKLYDGTVKTGHSGQKISTNWYYNNIYRADSSYEDQTQTYTIQDAEDLYGFASVVNGGVTFAGKGIVLKANSDFNLNKNWNVKSISVAGKVTLEGTATEWTAIGTKSSQFAGTFNGNDNTISGVYVNKPTAGAQGLFGYATADSIIKKFTLDNSYYQVGAESGCVVGVSEGSVDRIYVKDKVAILSAKDYIGGIVGDYLGDTESTIEKCWFDGTIVSEATCTGGIAGTIYNGVKTLDNCLFTGQILNTYSTNLISYAGGLVGRIYTGRNDTNAATVYMKNCVLTGSVTAKGTNAVGAVLGRAGNATTSVPTVVFENVYYTNEPINSDNTAFNTAVTTAGCGNNSANNTLCTLNGTPVQLENSQLTGTAAYKYTSLDLGNKSLNADTAVWVAMKNSAPRLNVFSDSDVDGFDDIQKIDTAWYYNNLTYNTAKGGQTTLDFEISNADEMYGLAYLVNSGQTTFKHGRNAEDTANNVQQTISLKQDIIFNNAKNGTEAKAWADGTASVPSETWVPIGIDDNHYFAGFFDGNGYTISGIYMNASDINSGLFGYLWKGTIKDLTLTNSYFVSTASEIGGLVGYGCGELYDIYNDAIVKGASGNVGGFVGRGYRNQTLSFNNCWFAGSVTNTSSSAQNAGGFIGETYGDANFTNCLNSGTISAPNYNTPDETNTDKIWPYVGGFVGFIRNNKTLDLSYCLNVGEVTYHSTATDGFGSILGRANTGTTIKASSVYVTTTSCDEIALYYSGVIYDEFNVVKVLPNLIEGEDARTGVEGLFAATNVTDQGDVYWTTVSYASPVLKSFESKAVPGTAATLNALQTKIATAGNSSKTMTASLPSSRVTLSTPSSYCFSEGGCSDGTNFYTAYIVDFDYYESNTTTTDVENEVVIVKTDMNGNKIGQSEKMKLGHSNDMTYNPKTNCVIVCHGKGFKTLTCLNADTLEQVGETITVNMENFCIDYSETYNCYVIAKPGDRYIYILDSSFDIIYRYEQDSCNPKYITSATYAQGMSVDDKYMYFAHYDENSNNHVITVFDWKGNYITEMALTTGTSLEPETLYVSGNSIYVLIRQNTSSHLSTEKNTPTYLYKVTNFTVN